MCAQTEYMQAASSFARGQICLRHTSCVPFISSIYSSQDSGPRYLNLNLVSGVSEMSSTCAVMVRYTGKKFKPGNQRSNPVSISPCLPSANGGHYLMFACFFLVQRSK